MRIQTVIGLFFLVLQGCSDDSSWYRGNTHAHTVICGHADSRPEVVAKWYHDHGYNFLILSEHNHFIDPDSVTMPENRRDDFILIPGEEITGPRIIHTTAMNIRNLVSQQLDLEVKSEIIQNHVDGTLEAGGQAILNHPNYYYTVTARHILPVKQLYMFELYNGHPRVNNSGDEQHSTTEDLWDELLTQGMIMYGISSDDAHHFSKIDTQYSNPGRGWVMVRESKLTPGAITEAMNKGDFYASNGVMLRQCSVSNGTYHIEVDQEETLEELASPELHGRRVSGNEEGFTIEVIGPNGKVLSIIRSTKAIFDVDDAYAYVRPKVTFRRIHKDRGLEEFYAWGQPVFTDGRLGND
jgi:hypothetical protein